jgi:hypothetical protein
MDEQLPIDQIFHLWMLSTTWSGVKSDATGQWTTANMWFIVINHTISCGGPMGGFGVVNAWRTIPASMCSANCEIWRWHYSVGVFLMEWTWPSHNTAWKYKHRIQGHSDATRTVCGRNQFSDDDCLYQHDNAPCHKSRSVREWFVDSNILEMDWPAQSPDLNPTEHLWDELKYQFRSRPQRPTSIPVLTTALQEEWAAIPPETFRHLVESLPRRVWAVIKAKNGPTQY